MRRQVRAQPAQLCRAGAHIDVAVQRDDVPRAECVAVVSLAGVARGRAEVAEVAGGAGRLVFVIARDWMGATLVTPPRRVIAARELGQAAALVGVVSRREHGARDTVEQLCRRLGAPPAHSPLASYDVARAHEHRSRVVAGGDPCPEAQYSRPHCSQPHRAPPPPSHELPFRLSEPAALQSIGRKRSPADL